MAASESPRTPTARRQPVLQLAPIPALSDFMNDSQALPPPGPSTFSLTGGQPDPGVGVVRRFFRKLGG